jgi:hypothetical protein
MAETTEKQLIYRVKAVDEATATLARIRGEAARIEQAAADRSRAIGRGVGLL